MPGIVSGNVVEQQGTSWEVLFGIDLDDTTEATRANFFAKIMGNDKYTWLECLYTGTTALTLTEFANLPLGSTILAPVHATSGRLIVKVAAAGTSTWKYQAIAT